MTGKIDGDSNDGKELVFSDGDELTWNEVARAAGVGEPSYNNRLRSTSKRATTEKSVVGSSSRVPSVYLIDEDDTKEEEFGERESGFDLDEDFVDLAIEE